MLLIGGLIVLIVVGTPWGLIALVAALLGEIGEYFAWRRFLRRYRLRSGPETMIGQTAIVIDDCAPLGRVRLQGALWTARASDLIPAGERVRVTAIDGLTLDVEPDR